MSEFTVREALDDSLEKEQEEDEEQEQDQEQNQESNFIDDYSNFSDRARSNYRFAKGIESFAESV